MGKSFWAAAAAFCFYWNVSAGHATPQPPVKVGVATILSGDLGVLGRNIVDTAETYRRHYLRHNIKFIYEDARLSSADGLKAYQKLVNIDAVDVIIGGCSSNGTMAAKTLINSSHTPTITVVTGGRNVDQAGPYIFRIGNSDTLNGFQEAEAFINAGIKRVALLAEETEYTQDIAAVFVLRFKELGGSLVYNENFLPGTADFRSNITFIKAKAPGGIFMPTQTGTALGVFLKQWREQGGGEIPIHTTFVAAPNPDARRTAGNAIFGVYYMAPEYDRDSPELKKFFALYRADHGKDPEIPFHSAGTVDTLNMLQSFLDQNPIFAKEAFQQYLLTRIKGYHGLMGNYSFDAEGNADLGFQIARIAKENAGVME